jgi:microcystin-dependent protein
MGIKLSLSPEYVQMPIGSVVACATPTVPGGFLECNGAAVSRVTYATLFGLIGTYYGGGDGSTTFNIPDLRGAFIRGWDNGRTLDNGRGFGTYQGSNNRNHTHADGTGGTGNAANVSGLDQPSNVAMKYIIKY